MVQKAIQNAGAHPTLDLLVAPALAAIAASDPLIAAASGSQPDSEMPPQEVPSAPDELLDLRRAWVATAQVVLFTVKADRLGFTRLKGPCLGGTQAILWGAYDSPPEHDESRALHRLRHCLHTAEYAAGWDWVQRNLAKVEYGTWLWVRHETLLADAFTLHCQKTSMLPVSPSDSGLCPHLIVLQTVLHALQHPTGFCRSAESLVERCPRGPPPPQKILPCQPSLDPASGARGTMRR